MAINHYLFKPFCVAQTHCGMLQADVLNRFCRPMGEQSSAWFVWSYLSQLSRLQSDKCKYQGSRFCLLNCTQLTYYSTCPICIFRVESWERHIFPVMQRKHYISTQCSDCKTPVDQTPDICTIDQIWRLAVRSAGPLIQDPIFKFSLQW